MVFFYLHCYRQQHQTVKTGILLVRRRQTVKNDCKNWYSFSYSVLISG